MCYFGPKSLKGVDFEQKKTSESSVEQVHTYSVYSTRTKVIFSALFIAIFHVDSVKPNFQIRLD